MLLGNARKSQAAIDFVTSYGVALVIVTIAIAVVYKTSVLTPSLSTSSCTPTPNFSCDSFSINHLNGTLTLSMSQATGGPITINGAACSSQLNSTGGSGPQFGNVRVTNNPAYYPTGNWLNGAAAPNTVYSDGGATMAITCYTSAGAASGPVGTSFIGYVWLNYAVPGSSNTVQRVASVSAIYT
jgi:hypothetical protein